MATSLARQLRRLAAPQTNLLKADRKKASILFDPREAANISRDELYDLGLSGLEELEKLDARFSEYRATLFAASSKTFERAVQTEETNRQVDEQLDKFLILISPYFTLKVSHKALEWLVSRYHVHQYNTEAWVACVMPFHDTKTFVRAIQVLEIKDQFSRWHWLQALQKPGVPLTKTLLLNHCAHNLGFLKFVCQMMKKFLTIHSSKKELLKTFTAFYTTTIIGLMEHSGQIKEDQLAVLLPSIFEGLTSRIPDLVAGSYMIVAQLGRKAKLANQAAEEIVNHILKGIMSDMTLEALTLLVVLYSTQATSLTSVPKSGLKALVNRSSGYLTTAAGSMAGTYRVSAFFVPLIQSLLREMNQALGDTGLSQQFERMATLVRATVEDVVFVGQDRGDVIGAFVAGYAKCLERDGPVDERLRAVVKAALQRLEQRYPDCFERSVHMAVRRDRVPADGADEDMEVDGVEDDTQRLWKEEMGRLLDMSWDTEETTLFLKLNHSAAQVRATAVASVVTAVLDGRMRNTALAVSTVVERLVDSSPAVVLEVLRLQDKLLDLVPQSQQLALLTRSLAMGGSLQRRQWEPVRLQLIGLLCGERFGRSLQDDGQHVDLFLALAPFLYALEMCDLETLTAAVESPWGRSSPLVADIAPLLPKLRTLQDDNKTLSDRIYAATERSAPFARADLNERLFEHCVADLAAPSLSPSAHLVRILLATSLLRSLADDGRGAVARRAVDLLDALTRLSPSAFARKMWNTSADGLRVSPHLKRAMEGQLALEILVFCAMEAFEDVHFDWKAVAERNWSKLDADDGGADDAALLFFLGVFRFLVTGLASNAGPLYKKCLQRFFDKMGDVRVQIFVLSLLWNKRDVDDALKVVSLRMAAVHLRESSVSLAWTVQLKCHVVPQLLAALTCADVGVRRAALGVFQTLHVSMSTRLAAQSFMHLVENVNAAREELTVDADQVKVVLAKHLALPNASTVRSALFDCLVSTQVPDAVQAGLATALEGVNTVDILASLLPVMERLLEAGRDAGGAVLDWARSAHLSLLLERFTPAVASVLTTAEGWKVFSKALTTPDAFLAPNAPEPQLRLSPQDVLIEVVTKEFYRALDDASVRQRVYRLLLDIVVNTDKPVAARQARRALKRITFDAALLLPHLDFKAQAQALEAPAAAPVVAAAGVRNRRLRQASPKPSQSPLWSAILAVLEVLHSKKEVANVEQLIAPLFDLLKCCLDEEEQTLLEYSKQLILSCLLSCCQKLPSGESSTRLASAFNTGLIVQCIRVSNNPQTHHQALLLLSLAAQLFPSHVLHNIMAIFTFMGTSVLRQDDAYSFQVIAKTLESVIPTLIEASMNTAVEPVVTTVIHVFADALPEVPEHRRIAIFDKLLTTLDPHVYLWLAPTLILSNMATQGPRLGGVAKGDAAADARDRLTADVEFAVNVCHLYRPHVQLKACARILEYLHSLPMEKADARRAQAADAGVKDMTEGSAPFALEVHTTRQLCHFKLLLVNFVSTLLSSKRLIEQLVELDDADRPALEPLYRHLIETALQYTQSIARVVDLPAAVALAPNPKFWRSLLHRCYDVVDRVNGLLPRAMFVSVVLGLLGHAIPSIRRRAMELLSAKVQHQAQFFALPQDEATLLPLIPALTAIAAGRSPSPQEKAQALAEEEALNQQTAFFTLKLLCRLMGPSASAAFRPALDIVVDALAPQRALQAPTPILASALLCLAELVQSMSVSSLPYLPRYGANLVARLEDVAQAGHGHGAHSELLLLSVVTCVCKLVETLPQFLVPYLTPMLRHVCHLSTRHCKVVSGQEKPGQVQARLQTIRHALATATPPRALVASVVQVYDQVPASSASVAPLMAVLSESFAAMPRQDLVAHLPTLTSFFVRALDARSTLGAAGATPDEMHRAEEPLVAALVSMVLKLSEASFRSLFFQLYDWATQGDARPQRLVSFYNVTVQIAEKFKGLFVLFAGHFLANAAQVVTDANVTLKGALPFAGPHAEANTLTLLEYVLRCLYRICLHDNENFINKERFELLLEPLVDQLENQLGGADVAERRIKELLVPLLAQLAAAASDDYLWKALHYQLLMKTRNNSAPVRLASMAALSALVEKLGENYLALLPEAIPFFAELLEDDVHEVEMAAQVTIQNFENVLGENLQKYF